MNYQNKSRRLIQALLFTSFAVFISFLFLSENQAQAVSNSEVTFQPAGGLNDGTDEGTISGGKDTYVSFTRYGDLDADLGSGVNFGARTELIFDYYASYDGYPILKFDVSTLPSDIVSAKLYLYVTANCGGGSCPNMNWVVNSITSPWDEMGATWNTRPTLSGSYGTLNIPASPTGITNARWVSVDITGLYNGWKNGTITNYGIGFTRLGSTWDGGVWLNTIASSDHGTASLRPKLVIQSVSPQTVLSPGDMLIADPSAPSDQGGIYHFDSLGNQKAVYSGAYFEEPMGLAIDREGNLIVGDPQAFSLGGAIFKINPATRAQTVVSQGQYFVDPRGVAVAANGDIFVADSDAFNYYGGVIKVNPVTGAQTPVYISPDQNAGPYYLTIAPSGDILISDVSGFGQLGGIIRINPVTGAWTVVSSGGNFVDPLGVAVATSGDIFVADNTGKVIKVNSATGAQTVIASGGPFVCPTGIAFDNSGNLLVDDPCNEPGAVVKLNPTTGAAMVLASFGSSPHGIAVVPAAVTACIVSLSGVVSEWSGEGNANDTVGTNNGMLQGGATFVPGQIGQAFSFDGVDDFVSIVNATSLRLQNFTIDTWIKLTGPLPEWPASIAAFGQNGYAFAIDSGIFTGGAERSLILSKTGASQVNGPAVPNDEAWHHVAVTKSGSSVIFYIDGVGTPTSYSAIFTFDGAAGSDFAIGTNPIYASQNNPPSTYAFPGLVDELVIYNRALAPSEIEQRYQNGISCGIVPTDTIAPTIVVPAPIVVEAVSVAGTQVFYDAVATDNIEVTHFVCTPASGSILPLGITAVNCEANDAANNTASASFTVIVRDTTPPAMTRPAPITVETNSLLGASVDYEVPTAADSIGVASVTCQPPPGSNFPIGTTEVTCTATDTSGNFTSVYFPVTVKYIPPAFLAVNIDIKPGSYPNSINPKSKGKIPVAIFSTSGFNAPVQTNKTSLTFGKSGNEVSLAFCNVSAEDVNADGLADLVCHFSAPLSDFSAGDTMGLIKGRTIAGITFSGSDSVRIVP
jgi:hypothetical protein